MSSSRPTRRLLGATVFSRLRVKSPLTGAKRHYALYDGRFTRSIAPPDRDCGSEQLAMALSEYIKLFDKLMKAYVSGRLTAHEVEAAYYSQMINSPIHI